MGVNVDVNVLGVQMKKDVESADVSIDGDHNFNGHDNGVNVDVNLYGVQLKEDLGTSSMPKALSSQTPTDVNANSVIHGSNNANGHDNGINVNVNVLGIQDKENVESANGGNTSGDGNMNGHDNGVNVNVNVLGIQRSVNGESANGSIGGDLDLKWAIREMANISTLLAPGNLAVSFQDCGDASTGIVVKDVTPKTIVAGSTTTITGSGSLKKDLAGATYNMTMTGILSTVLVKDCSGDAGQAQTCDIVAPLLGKVGSLAYQPVTFPIKAGDIGGIPKVAVTLKSGLPASLETTTTTLKVTASNGDNAICVQIMTKAAATSLIIV